MTITIRSVLVDKGDVNEQGEPVFKDGYQLVIDDIGFGPAYSSPCELDEVREWWAGLLSDPNEIGQLYTMLTGGHYV